MISRADAESERHLASNLTHALLAAPSTGGAVTLILRRSPCNPTIIFFDERGCTCYTRLYDCTAVAEVANGREASIRKREIRDLSVNLIKKVPDTWILSNPEKCTQYFTPKRWEAFKKDVDRTLIRENLKLTVEERLLNLQDSVQFIEELRVAGRMARERRGSGKTE